MEKKIIELEELFASLIEANKQYALIDLEDVDFDSILEESVNLETKMFDLFTQYSKVEEDKISFRKLLDELAEIQIEMQYAETVETLENFARIFNFIRFGIKNYIYSLRGEGHATSKV